MSVHGSAPMLIHVHGDPVAQGSMSAGRGRVFHASKGLRPWRDKVTKAAFAVVSELDDAAYPTSDPVRVSLHFLLRRPKRTKRERPTVVPDLDKLSRAVLDALTGVVYADDAQVVSLHASKVYAFQPHATTGVYIHITTYRPR